jgi:PAS domain S-box-containing protein
MSAARAGRPPRGYALRDRLLLFTLGIVVLLLGVTLGIIDAFVRQQVRRDLTVELQTTASVSERFLDLRAGWMRGQSHVVAEDPRFTATLDLPGADPAALARTVLNEARSFQGLLDSELFVVTDPEGRALARLDISRRAARSARTRVGARDVWTVDGIDYAVTSVAVRGDTVHVGLPADRRPPSSADLQAVLDAALDPFDLDDLLDRFAADLAARTPAGGARPEQLMVRRVGSGDDVRDWPAIRTGLQGRPWEGLHLSQGRLFHVDVVPVWSPDQLVGVLLTGFEIDDALAGELRDMTRSHITFLDEEGRPVASTWQGAARDSVVAGWRSRAEGETFEIRVGQERFLTRIGRFGQAGPAGAAGGGTYLMQRSLDAAFEFLRTLEEVLLGVGIIVLALAAGLGFLGARRITQPVGALVEGTRRLATGDLEHRIVERSRSELGELAASFNDMAGALSRSRDALQESERAYRDLFDNAQDLVFTCDLEHRIRTVNRAGLASLGYGPGELTGRSLFDLIVPAQRQRVAESMRAVPTGGPRPPVEASLQRQDGSESTFEIVSRWVVEAGEPVGIHGIGRDITERRERERATIRFREQLAQAEKLRALGEMAAGVAHNFNNLLTVVVGNAELITLNDDLPEPIRRDTQMILDSARRGSAIVRRIQTFGRPIDMADVTEVDLCDVARDIVDITSPKWKTEPEREGRRVRVGLDLESVPPILTQGSAWEEILSNLIFNAVDALPDGGEIQLSTRLEEDSVVLRVRDNGTGMDEETKRRIFEPFYSTKEESAGTGLGLSTVWGLVSTLGGTVDVESRPGGGTTFALRMPVAPQPQERVGAPASRAPVERGLRVLVVDDEPRVLELVPPLLADHVVDTAADGGQGLTRLAEADYDIVLSDWVMAEASGLEVAAEAKARNADTVVVLMTGWDPGGAQTDQEAVDLRLPKPFEREDVERVLAEAVALRRERAAQAGGGPASG